MKALVIYNPNSGKKSKRDISSICKEVLEEYGYDVTLIRTEHPNHAKEIVEKCPHYDVVFSIGGDGTLNEVIAGNYEREDKLNICPLPNGTCNDVASMLGYGKNPRKNLEDALDGDLHDFDIGTINDKPFIYVVGCGKFMNIPYQAEQEQKQKMGYLSYIMLGAKEISKKMKVYRAKIKIDDKELEGNFSMIMISNSNHIAGIDNFYKDVMLDDNTFEVLLCKSDNIFDMVINFAKFLLGLDTDQIVSLSGHDISITLDEKPEENWCVDGEMLHENPENYRIEVKSKMKILTSKKANKKKLFG